MVTATSSKAYYRRYYRANRETILEQKRGARLKNPRKFRERDRLYREANRDRRNEYMRKYRLKKRKSS